MINQEISWGSQLSKPQVLLAMSFYALELCPNCDLAGGLIKVRDVEQSHDDWVTERCVLPVYTQPVNELRVCELEHRHL